MSDKLRAAAQAALEWLKDERLNTWPYMEGSQFYTDRDKQVKALEAALAEPEQEPVGKFSKFSDGVWKEVTASSPGIFLYTAPPRREWVGLTAEDMADAHNSTSGDVMMRLAGFARAIEAMLRERNGG